LERRKVGRSSSPTEHTEVGEEAPSDEHSLLLHRDMPLRILTCMLFVLVV